MHQIQLLNLLKFMPKKAMEKNYINVCWWCKGPIKRNIRRFHHRLTGREPEDGHFLRNGYQIARSIKELY